MPFSKIGILKSMKITKIVKGHMMIPSNRHVTSCPGSIWKWLFKPSLTSCTKITLFSPYSLDSIQNSSVDLFLLYHTCHIPLVPTPFKCARLSNDSFNVYLYYSNYHYWFCSHSSTPALLFMLDFQSLTFSKSSATSSLLNLVFPCLFLDIQ